MSDSSWYHLTKRRTKDNKPKVYGDVCHKKKNLKCLASVVCENVQLNIYEDNVGTMSYDNFITACLPGKLSTLYTQAHDIYIQATPRVSMQYWKNLPFKQCTTYNFIN